MNKTYLIFILSIGFAYQAHSMSFLYEDQSINLNDKFNEMAKKDFAYSGDCSEYFNTSSLKDSKSLEKFLKQEKAQKFELLTEGGVAIDAYLLNRGSDKAILIGQGLACSCKVLIPYAKLFPDYDLLIINYRLHNWSDALKFLSCILNDSMNKYILEATNDVISAVNFLRNQGHYKTVTGIGLCYSALVYTIAQATVFSQENQKLLFDKLILDSSFYSTQEIANSTIKDPILCCDNKHGGTPSFIQSMLSVPFISDSVKFLGNKLLNEKFENLSMEWYLPMIAYTPIMFIHGKKDLLVPYRYFECTYKGAYNTPHCALITPYEHAISHIKAKEAYAYLGRLFIEASSMSEFAYPVLEYFSKLNEK